MDKTKIMSIPGRVPDSLVPWGHQTLRSGGCLWYDGVFIKCYDYNGKNGISLAMLNINMQEYDMRKSIVIAPVRNYSEFHVIRNEHSTCDFVSFHAPYEQNFILEINRYVYDKMCILYINTT